MFRSLVLFFLFGCFQLQASDIEPQKHKGRTSIPLVHQVGGKWLPVTPDEPEIWEKANHAVQETLGAAIRVCLDSLSALRSNDLIFLSLKGSARTPLETALNLLNEKIVGLRMQRHTLAQRFGVCLFGFSSLDPTTPQKVCCQELPDDFAYDENDFDQVVQFLSSCQAPLSVYLSDQTLKRMGDIKRRYRDALHLEAVYGMLANFLDSLEKAGFRPFALWQAQKSEIVSLGDDADFVRNLAQLLTQEQAGIYAYRTKSLAGLKEFYAHVRPIEDRNNPTITLLDPLYIQPGDNKIMVGATRHFVLKEALPTEFSTRPPQELLEILLNLNRMRFFHECMDEIMKGVNHFSKGIVWSDRKKEFTFSMPIRAQQRKPAVVETAYSVEDILADYSSDDEVVKTSKKPGQKPSAKKSKAQRKKQAQQAEQERETRLREEKRKAEELAAAERDRQRELEKQKTAKQQASHQANDKRWTTVGDGKKKPKTTPITIARRDVVPTLPRKNTTGSPQPLLTPFDGLRDDAVSQSLKEHSAVALIDPRVEHEDDKVEPATIPTPPSSIGGEIEDRSDSTEEKVVETLPVVIDPPKVKGKTHNPYATATAAVTAPLPTEEDIIFDGTTVFRPDQTTYLYNELAAVNYRLYVLESWRDVPKSDYDQLALGNEWDWLQGYQQQLSSSLAGVMGQQH